MRRIVANYPCLAPTRSEPISALDATKASYKVLSRIGQRLVDRNALFVFMDWGGHSEFLNAKPILDEVVGEDRYSTAKLVQASDKIRGYRPVTGSVVRHRKGMWFPKGVDVNPIRPPLHGSGRYITIPEEGNNFDYVAPRWYEIPRRPYNIYFFDDWSTSGASTIGQDTWAIRLKNELKYSEAATIVIYDFTGLVNYPLVINEKVSREKLNPRSLLRKRLPPDIRDGADLISSERFFGIVQIAKRPAEEAVTELDSSDDTISD